MRGAQFGQIFLAETGNNLVGLSLGAVDVGGNVYRTTTVHAADARIAATGFNRGDFTEGNRAAVTQPNAHSPDILRRSATCGRIANHHPHVIPVALDALRFLTVKSLTYLLRQIGLGQAERFRLGPNTYHPFAFPELKRISNILNARIGCQSLFQFCRRRLQSFQIRTAQSNVNRLACGEHISAETDFRNSGYVAHGRPPAIGNLLAGDGAFLRGRNFNVHFSLVAAKMVCLIVAPGEF